MSQDTRNKSHLQIVPRSPILSSLDVSDLLRVEQHRQPAKESSECCLPHYLLSIHLGQPIQLERNAEGQRRSVHLTPGDIMLTPPDLHRKLSWNTDAEFLLLRLEPNIFVSAVNETVESENIEMIPHIKIRDPLLQQIGLALKAELKTKQLDRLYAESMANALAVHVLRRYSTRKPIIRAYGGLPNHKLQQAIDYIQTHLAEDISLKAIASELGISQYHFARLFKQSTGYSPYQYLIKCRIERAQELLKQTQQIAHVALQVGFASQSQFGRHFKRLTGVTPKQFL
ncbi:transcriptional regulator, AraC family [Gloeocapsa sp. PCC 7428]|uniref:helix-turn-helix domain-containing protein n=1 Tax=Gloeocapsa sp. PCC 7428 TaxID=1173026 RepID=UPI0002A5E588|nr:AraC family transcriptional regulator [Gloeocapsa sp. PCC 7428]AFZ32000.1 transcriptional regulator, AraC family [Gloeocapsa sp. PCC 7428]